VAALPERGTSPEGAERDESVLDDVEERLGFRAFFAKHPALDLTYRIVVGLLGGAIVVLGIILIPLPGPGWLIVFAGLALLATEFVWAERLLGYQEAIPARDAIEEAVRHYLSNPPDERTLASYNDSFDYDAEDRAIEAYRRAIMPLLETQPETGPVAHPYAHPVEPGAVDHRGR